VGPDYKIQMKKMTINGKIGGLKKQRREPIVDALKVGEKGGTRRQPTQKKCHCGSFQGATTQGGEAGDQRGGDAKKRELSEEKDVRKCVKALRGRGGPEVAPYWTAESLRHKKKTTWRRRSKDEGTRDLAGTKRVVNNDCPLI